MKLSTFKYFTSSEVICSFSQAYLPLGTTPWFHIAWCKAVLHSWEVLKTSEGHSE